MTALHALVCDQCGRETVPSHRNPMNGGWSVIPAGMVLSAGQWSMGPMGEMHFCGAECLRIFIATWQQYMMEKPVESIAGHLPWLNLDPMRTDRSYAKVKA